MRASSLWYAPQYWQRGQRSFARQYHTEDYGKTKHLVRENSPGLLVHQDAFFIAGWTSGTVS